MARLSTFGAEAQLGGFHADDASAALSGATITTSNVRSGNAAVSCAADGNIIACDNLSGALDRSYFARAYMQFSSVAPANPVWIIQPWSGGTGFTFGVRLETNGTLTLRNAAGTQVGSASSALSINTYYRIEHEYKTVTGGGAASTLGLYLDGVQVARATNADAGSAAKTEVDIGRISGTATLTITIDDVAVNDDQGANQNTLPGSGKIVMLVPISDNSRTGFTGGGGGTTNLFDANNNTPPTGAASPGTNASQNGSATNNATDNYILNLGAYTTALGSGGGGLGASDTVTLVQALARGGNSTTTSRNFGIQSTSNPVIAETTVGSGTTAAGTEPTGWTTQRTAISYAPSVTLGNSPAVEFRKATASTDRINCDLMGLVVEYVPSSSTTWELAGQSDGVGAVSGDLTETFVLAGQSDGAGAPSGDLTGTWLLGGQIDGVGTPSGDLTLAGAAPISMGGGFDPPSSTLRLQVETPDGQGFDLSSVAQDLEFSNVRPGGDEACSWTMLKSWLDSNPEVKRGSIVRVMDGLDILWQGRLEELDRGLGDTETMTVTAFGLGARLKDGLFRQIFIDRDLATWTPAGRARRISFGAGAPAFDPQVTSDTDNGLPALQLVFTGAWAATARSDAFYDCGSDLTWATIYYSTYQVYDDASMSLSLYSSSGESAGFQEAVALDSGTGTSASGYYSPVTARRFAMWELNYAGPGGGEAVDYSTFLRKLAVYGNHGLSRQGADPGGFTANQIIGYVVGLVNGITPRYMSNGNFVITQFVIDTPTHHEDAIGEAAAFEVSTWGTWGPNNILDRSTNGYFDFTVINETTQYGDWIVSRAECDDLQLHDEIGSLYNQLRISWADSSGEGFVENRSTTIPVLDEAGITRIQELDAGSSTQATAQQLGDVYFALQGTNPPSRGSATFTGQIKHNSRGYLPPHYLRADGSTIKIRDVLPRSEALSLGTEDRRTIFPIERVTVDASNAIRPTVSVDLDQTPDRLSVIQARLSEAAQALGGGSISRTTPSVASQTGAGKGDKKKKKKGIHFRRKRQKSGLG